MSTQTISGTAAHESLRGRTVVVVGGSGGVGQGVARALLDRGATVIATGRRSGPLRELSTRLGQASLGRLVTTTLDAEAADLDAQVHRLASEHGPFDGVVVSVASWGKQGQVQALDLTDSQWDASIRANLTNVFRLFRAFLPVTRPSGMIVQLNGMSADLAFPGAAGVALSAAATKSLTRTIAAERAGHGPRFYNVILGVVRTRARQERGVDNGTWIDGEQIGAHVADLVAHRGPLADTTVHYLVDKAAGPQPEPERG